MGKKGAKSRLTSKELRAIRLRIRQAEEAFSAALEKFESLGRIVVDGGLEMKNIWLLENGVNHLEGGTAAAKSAVDSLYIDIQASREAGDEKVKEVIEKAKKKG